jgi:hypothetical protein
LARSIKTFAGARDSDSIFVSTRLTYMNLLQIFHHPKRGIALILLCGGSALATSAATVSPDILAFAERAFMTKSARELFYSKQPQLVDRRAVNEKCKTVESFIVQGCFADGKIFIHKISDTRIQDSMTNTAAHEMLHAAYEKLNSSERKTVDGTIAHYIKLNGYGNFEKKIAQYTDSYEKFSELHSILGTEIETLPKELEQYYSRYFTQRGNLVQTFKRFRSVIEQRQTAADLLEAQSEKAKPEIMNEKMRIHKVAEFISSEERTLDALKKVNAVDRFNAMARKHNNQVSDLKEKTRKLNSKINNYNKLIKTRNDLVGELKGLYQVMEDN